MLRNYAYVDDSAVANDGFVETFSLIGRFFKRLHKKLLKFVMKKSLQHMQWGMHWIIGEWLVAHNRVFMMGHVIITWSLIIYRAYRRVSWKSSTKRDGPQMGRGDCAPVPDSSSASDADETIFSTEDLSFIGDLDASLVRCGPFDEKKKVTWADTDWSSSAESSSVTHQEKTLVREKSQGVTFAEEKKLTPKKTSSENIIKKLQDAADEGLPIEDVIELEKKPEQYSSEDEGDEEGSINTIGLNQRRVTVCAEYFDPEEEDEVKHEVYPKTPEQRAKLAMTVKDDLLFRQLDSAQMREVIDAMSMKVVKKGDVIIKEGDDGDFFYVIDSGTYEVYKKSNGKEELIKTYQGVGSFGELALMYNMPRAATVKAVTDGSVWALDRITYRALVLKAAYKKRKMYSQLISKVSILNSLTPQEKMSLVDALEPMSFKRGTKIISQGDEANGMYFILQGEVRITVKDEMDNDVELKVLSAGDYFGELALLTHKPRAASAYALGLVKLAFLDKGGFERLLGPCIHIMERKITSYEEERTQQIQKK